MISAPHPRFLYGSLFVALLLLGASVVLPRDTTAATGSVPITGWAWAGNQIPGSTPAEPFMGWISFSPNNPGSGGGNYGVFENTTTGEISGYAWSTNLGRISFNGTSPNELSGCPSGGTCTPKVDWLTGKLSGWARACSAFQTGCSGALDQNSGGWDGWISLAGTAQDGSAYGVTQNTSNSSWSGYAWGSDAIGAISMSGTAENGREFSVVGPPRPTLTASNYTIDWGDTVTLTWGAFPDAGSCQFGGNTPPTSGATTGNAPTGPLANNTNYMVTCASGMLSIDSLPITITVRQPFVNVFSAVPNRVASGGKTTVKWDISNAATCTITRNGDNWQPLTKSGTSITGSIVDIVTIKTTYALTCSPTTQPIVVNIVPSFIEF